MSNNKLCCIFNYAPHYQFPILKEMDNGIHPDFYFGDSLPGGECIKKLDFNELAGFKGEYKARFWGKFENSRGWLPLVFNREYQIFLITPNYLAINQWLFLIFCKMLNKNVYIWTHGIKTDKPKKALTFRARIYDSLIAGTFLYGERPRKIMIKLGFDAERLFVIYNSLDYDNILKYRKTSIDNLFYKSHFGNDNPVIVFIGRLIKSKKLEYLIQLEDYFSKKNKPINVVFVGDGPEREYLQSKIIEQHRKNFWFAGAQYDEDTISKFLSNATLCVSPGNIGLTAIHAHSYGLPVITNNNFDLLAPEFEAISQYETGDFFVDGNFDSLVKCVESWLEKNANRSKVRERCYQIIDDKWNPHNQIEILKKHLV